MLVAVIFTLLPYQHQPLPSLPYHISINTLISVLITAMKASSLVVLAEGLGQLKWEYLKTPRPLQHLQDYDTASRGPWGCLKLLVALRGHGILTSIGAVISILIIAVDPFGQQLVGYYSCNVPLTNGTVATIPRSSIYNELGLSRYRAGNGPSGSPTTAQRNAVVNGFFAPDSVKIVPDCNTGNCTYSDTYATIGFCAKCEDATKELQSHLVSIPVSSFWTSHYFNTSLPSGLTASIDTDTIASTSMSDPNMTVFTMATTAEISGDITSSPHVKVEMILGNSSNGSPGWWAERFGGYNTPNSSCVHFWQRNAWGCQGEGAARCSITPCVKTLRASVESGVLKETAIEEYTDWFLGMAENSAYVQFVMADLSCVNKTTRQTLHALGFNVSDSRFMPYSVSIGYDGKLTELSSVGNWSLSQEQLSLIPRQCIYQIDYYMLSSLLEFLESYLTVQVGIGDNGYLSSGNLQALAILNDTYISIDSVTKTFNGVADALSIRAREWNFNGSRSSDGSAIGSADGVGVYNVPAKGTIQVTETCIVIRWPWIVYPATMVLLTVLFFIALLVTTELHEEDGFARGWKNSVLPFVYHGISKFSTAEDVPRLPTNSIRSMNEAAEQESGYIYNGKSSIEVVETPPLQASKRE